jgi:hypothetical protein
MRESRRVFLGLAVGAATAAVARAGQFDSSQQNNPSPVPPATMSINPRHPSRRNLNAQLRVNQVTIKKDVAKLSDLVANLQKGLSDADTKEVLSLDVLHMTDQIEKLVRQIRDLVRG